MQSVETLALQTYENNVAYFQKSQPKLLEMINVLNLAIEKGDYSPQYDLEYIKDYFDVKELASGNYLYATSSSKVSKEFTSIVNFKKNSYSYEGLPVYRSNNIQDKDSDKGRGLEGIYPIMDYYLDNTKDDDSMRSIEKFIFVGVALGFHISEIAKKVESKYYLIIEDDLELFRLSLFTTDYAGLARKSELYFAIADDDNLFLKTINPFLENAFFDNRYLKYAHFPTHSTNKLKQIQNAILSQTFISFQYKTELYKHLRPLEYLNNDYKVLNLSRHIQNELFYSKPVLLITAGPSLEKNIEWLKANHKRFVIVAVSATLRTLYKHNITPTIVTHVDGFSTSMKHYGNLPVKEFLKNTLVVLGPFADSLLKKLFTKEQLYYFEEETEYIKDFGSISAPCVGSFSLLLSLIFNTKELYLLGLDFAVDQKTGATHATSHAHNETVDMLKKDDVSDTMSLRDNLLPVQGNFEPKVYTNTLFNFSLQSLQNNILKVKKEDQKVYNLNDGAYIYATTPTKIEDVDVSSYKELDKSEIFSQVQEILDKHSIKKLDDADMESMKKRLDYSLSIKSKITHYAQSVSKTSPESFMSDLLGIVSSIVKVRNRETGNIVQVYYSYFKHVLPIVFDLFNTQGLKNKKQHIKRLNEMILKEMKDIEGIYSKTLSDFLDGNLNEQKRAMEEFGLKLYESIDKEKLRTMHKKNSIGFMATKELILNGHFIEYIKELSEKFQEVTFSAFYFSQEDKETIEKNIAFLGDRLELIKPQDIYDIAEHTEIYLYQRGGSIDQSIYIALLSNSKSIIAFETMQITQTVHTVDSFNGTHPVLINPEHFGLTTQDVLEYDKSYTRVIYERTLHKVSTKKDKIDSHSADFYRFGRIEWILHVEDYKSTLIETIFSRLV